MNEHTKNKIFKIGFFALWLGTSALFILYHLIVWFKVHRLGETYNFFSFTHPDPYSYWAPMFRDILDGHFWITDGRIAEHVFLPSLWSFVSPLVAAPVILLTRNISYAFLLGEFLAALGAFVVFYFLAKAITKHRLFSLFFTTVFSATMLIWEFLFPISFENLKMVARAVFHLGSPAADVLMGRYVSLSIFPALPIFSLTFFAILMALKSEWRAWTIAAGLLCGLLIYLVITDATFIFAGLFIILILSLTSKNYVVAKKIVFIFGIAILASSFYWSNFLAIRALPWAGEFYRRLGGDFGHAIRVSFWKNYAAYALAAWLVWQWGKRYNRPIEALFISSFLLAPIAVLNMQVITGFNPQPTVWFTHQFYFGFALGWLVLSYWLYDWFAKKGEKWKKRISIIFFAFIISILVRTTYTHWYIARDQYKHNYIPKNILRSLHWLNNNTPIDSVVVSPSLVTNVVVPVETHNRTMIPVSVSSPASINEIRDRVMTVYKLFAVPDSYLGKALVRSREQIDDFAVNQENNLMVWIYDTYFFDTSLDSFFRGRGTNNVPEEIIKEDTTRYHDYPNKIDYLLNRYKIDYFYIGPYERRISKANFDTMKFLEKVYDEDGVSLYKIKK